MRGRSCLVVVALLAGAVGIAAAQEGAQDKVAALKESLQKSAANLKHYEWIETTTVSMDGEQKSSTQKRCYYGADGTLTKVDVGGGQQQQSQGRQPRGLRGRIVEEKKEEVHSDVEGAVALIKQYVPPDPAKIDAAKADGRLSIVPPDAGGKMGIKITNYVKPGDSLSLGVHAATAQMESLAVDYADSEKDVVHLDVAFASLNDGTTYEARSVLTIKSQSMQIVVENSGYKKSGT